MLRLGYTVTITKPNISLLKIAISISNSKLFYLVIGVDIALKLCQYYTCMLLNEYYNLEWAKC